MAVKTLFFAVLLLVASGFLSGSVREADSSTGLSLGCAVGDVLPDGAVVWLRAEAESEVLVRYSRDPDLKVFAATQAVVVKETSDFTATLVLRGLEPATVYHYQGVVVGKEPGPVCKFVTAPRPDSLTDVQFAFGGCTRESFQPFSIMESIRVMTPDFFVFMGDTIYADRDGPASKMEEFWSKYVRNRNDGSMQRLLSETSLYITWDDHEVANNYDSGHPLAPIGQKAFFDYWPIQREPEDPNRLYRSFRWGKAVELFILDARQYRDPAARTMLGEKQKKWLLEEGSLLRLRSLNSFSPRFRFQARARINGAVSARRGERLWVSLLVRESRELSFSRQMYITLLSVKSLAERNSD